MLLEVEIRNGKRIETIYMDENKVIMRGNYLKDPPHDIDDLINRIKNNLISPSVQTYYNGFSIKGKNGYVRYFYW